MRQRANVRVIRRRKPVRMLIVVPALVVLGVLAIGLAIAVADRSPQALALLAFGALIAADRYTDYRVSVEMSESGLLVQNRLRRYELPREDIAGFHIGTAGWDPFSECIHATTRDGQDVELAVTRRADFVVRGRVQLEQFLADLTEWKVAPVEPPQLQSP